MAESIEGANQIAQQKGSLMYFPEGNFTRRSGLAPFHMAAFIASAKNHRPIVLITIHGSRSMLRECDWFPRNDHIVVKIGDPIRVEPNDNNWQTATGLKDKARIEILSHCGEPDLDKTNLPSVMLR